MMKQVEVVDAEERKEDEESQRQELEAVSKVAEEVAGEVAGEVAEEVAEESAQVQQEQPDEQQEEEEEDDDEEEEEALNVDDEVEVISGVYVNKFGVITKRTAKKFSITLDGGKSTSLNHRAVIRRRR